MAGHQGNALTQIDRGATTHSDNPVTAVLAIHFHGLFHRHLGWVAWRIVIDSGTHLVRHDAANGVEDPGSDNAFIRADQRALNAVVGQRLAEHLDGAKIDFHEVGIGDSCHESKFLSGISKIHAIVH